MYHAYAYEIDQSITNSCEMNCDDDENNGNYYTISTYSVEMRHSDVNKTSNAACKVLAGTVGLCHIISGSTCDISDFADGLFGIIFILVMLASLFSFCGKNWPGNGNIDANWFGVIVASAKS
ncbi:unnamed protein product [Phytophthora lilii]|uniref:Unnamed protein product n=1 Tax=Phytophthora lilii TaxID=2077276 RepID=A0A9W6X1Y1_9STRA|nr:unnamed protein product [Phytophthora lilii]